MCGMALQAPLDGSTPGTGAAQLSTALQGLSALWAAVREAWPGAFLALGAWVVTLALGALQGWGGSGC